MSEVETVDENEIETNEAPKESVSVNDLRDLSFGELRDKLVENEVHFPSFFRKSNLVLEWASFLSKQGHPLTCTGIIEQTKDKFGMLRDDVRSFKTSPDDCYIAPHLMKEFNLSAGKRINAELRGPKGRDKYLTVTKVITVENEPAEEHSEETSFDHLTSLFPEDRLQLDSKGETNVTGRLIDLMSPIGKGQRGLIVAPPRGGKTMVLKSVARAIEENHPEVELMVLLLDERPEEVTDFEENIKSGHVYASTFDEPSKRHAQVADLVLERAKRLVEQKKDVVILLDSLTRLARGFNNAATGGSVMSGGLKPQALQKARKFFSTARNVEEGGSLTIVATALVETESRMDDIVFEELKGTGNMEVKLDRDLAELRVFPAIHLFQSATRNDQRLYHKDEFLKIMEIRKELTALPAGEALERLINNIKKTGSNAELLLRGLT